MFLQYRKYQVSSILMVSLFTSLTKNIPINAKVVCYLPWQHNDTLCNIHMLNDKELKNKCNISNIYLVLFTFTYILYKYLLQNTTSLSFGWMLIILHNACIQSI